MRDDALLPRIGDLLLGRYRIEELVGRGANGVVFAARHAMLDQRVAVKVLQPEVDDEESRRRLLRDARASIGIRSDHVAQVADAGTLESGLPFVITQLVEGKSLRDLLDANGPLPVERAIDFCLQALEGIATAHGIGIVHGDLKLSNVFVVADPDGAEALKIVDFGLSSLAATSPHVSPEQVQDVGEVDARADVWALGMILYELLTGVPPFSADSSADVFVAILDRRPDLPVGLDQVIFRCLQRDADARFSTVAELARALAPFGAQDAEAQISRIDASLAVEAAPDTRRGGYSAPGRGGTLIMRMPLALPSPAIPSSPAPAPPPSRGPPSGPPPIVPPHLIVRAAPAAPPPQAKPSVALIAALAAAVIVLLGVLALAGRAFVIAGPSAGVDAGAPVASSAPAAPVAPVASAAPEPSASAPSVSPAVPPATGVATTQPDDTPPPSPPAPPASATSTASSLPPRVLPAGSTNPSILDKRR